MKRTTNSTTPTKESSKTPDQSSLRFTKEDILPVLYTADQLNCHLLVVDIYGNWEGWCEDIDDENITLVPLKAPTQPGFKVKLHDVLAISIIPHEPALD